jgi:hypothetical protein
VANSLEDPFIRRSLKVALHVRRYLPFYVFSLIWVVLLALFPTFAPGSHDRTDNGVAVNQTTGTAATTPADAGTAGEASTADTTATQTAAAPTGGAATVASGAKTTKTATTKTVAAAPADVKESVATAKAATGKTRGGIDCGPDVRQLPDSRYAPQCTNAYTGDNGGATSKGVSADTIVVVRRGFADSANSQAADQIAKQAGAASDADVYATRDIFIKYFDQMFEMYGRHFKFIDYESKYGDSTKESLGTGKDGACKDAQYIEDNFHPFIVIGGKNTAGVSANYAECGAALGQISLAAAGYYPESWYKKYHPYAWGGVMECERISYQVGEYIWKRLANKNAIWAGDENNPAQNYHNTKRQFAMYIPDNDGYQQCGKILDDTIAAHGVKKTDRYNYQLDLSRFADQAAQAVVQFQADGDTTIVMADDPYSNLFLTQAAAKQHYYPEWFHIGTALNDLDNVARLWDPTEVNCAATAPCAATGGHLWGMSQLGSTQKLIGPASEEGRLYKRLTGKDIPSGTDGQYWGYIGLYSFIQTAGPNLTPESAAEGVFESIPGGAPDYPVGYISYQDGPDGTPGARDHTGIDDTREIFWVHDPNMAPNASSDPGSCSKSADPYYNGLNDGCEGTYKETYGGKRFKNGQWPEETPPLFTKH